MAAIPFEAAKVPYLTASQKTALAGYQSGAPPKALAVGSTGAYAYQVNTAGDLGESEARRRVLERCQYYNGGPCVLYSVNGALIRADARALTPTPVTIKGNGRFDPATVPFVSQTVRDTKMTAFAAARQHKALALHPTGAWATITGRATVEEAAEAALEHCATFKEQGCVIYAQDDEVVFDNGPADGATKGQVVKVLKQR